ncbi:hypothetical protein AYO40_00540 [Planctomycetaceae bacterium SCGC AG-212-D15]|nr:hypothetical protein AYO40_00540 [Planctomycetaceae bacterium SCGC AG-212-D15]
MAEPGKLEGGTQIPGDWLRAARQGSSDALGRIFEAFREEFTRLAQLGMADDLRAKAGASDVVQQTFLEAHRDIAQFSGDSAEEFRAWLRRILEHNVRNIARAYREREKRQLARELPLGVVPGDALILATPSPSAKVANQERVAALEAAISRLPAEYQEVIRLRQQEQKSFAEIGAAMGRSGEAARKLWVRALQRLKQELGESQ